MTSSTANSQPDAGSSDPWWRNTWRDVEERGRNRDWAGSLARVVDSMGEAADKSLQKMADWGEEFEQRAFDGDLLGSVTRSLIGDVEERVRWQYYAADGWPIDARAVPDINGPRTQHRLKSGDYFWVTEERASTDGVLYLRLADGAGWLFDRKPNVGVLCTRAPPELQGPSSSSSSSAAAGGNNSSSNNSNNNNATTSANAAAAAAASGAGSSRSSSVGAAARNSTSDAKAQGLAPNPWEAEVLQLEAQVKKLQDDLAAEKEQHRGRLEALRTLQMAIPQLHAELAQEAVRTAASDIGSLSSHELRAQSLEKAYLELQEKHHLLKSREARQAAELQRFKNDQRLAVAADYARAGVAAAGGTAAREWARDGPETEALKSAKLEHAEAMGLIDETRLISRKELRELNAAIEHYSKENDYLRHYGEAYVAPQGSMLKSFRRLLSVAVGKPDPFPQAEDALA